MVFQNYEMSGTVRFGSPLMDKSTFIIDILDAQIMLDMNNGSGEILGYFKNNKYDDKRALTIAKKFNSKYISSSDEYAPVMVTLKTKRSSCKP